jgi:hypothetical protein
LEALQEKRNVIGWQAPFERLEQNVGLPSATAAAATVEASTTTVKASQPPKLATGSLKEFRKAGSVTNRRQFGEAKLGPER